MKNKSKLKIIFTTVYIFSICIFQKVYAQPVPGSYYDFIDETSKMPVKPNPSRLIIYRPQNKGTLNEIRCYLKLENEKGEDVTYTACKATYEWVGYTHPDPKKQNRTLDQTFREPKIPTYNYKTKYYLSGGMAMHLNIKKGKYKITVYTPAEEQTDFIYPDVETSPFLWESNTFEYNTENPAKVIFVSPLSNENGFYCGGWKINHKAPKYHE